MKYTEVTFQIRPYSQTAADLLAALLGEQGFETFTEAGLALVGAVIAVQYFAAKRQKATVA